jgi:hypothetical protein
VVCFLEDGAFTLTGWDFKTMVRFALPFIGIVGNNSAWNQNTKLQAMELLHDIDVPYGPILDIKEMIEDEALAERGMIVDVKHSRRGLFKTEGSHTGTAAPRRLSSAVA